MISFLFHGHITLGHQSSNDMQDHVSIDVLDVILMRVHHDFDIYVRVSCKVQFDISK